jgi:DNA-binding MarR family transcriptional regulator
MRNHSSHNQAGQTPHPTHAESDLAGTPLQDAGKTIHAMATLSRELKHATATLEKIAHAASGTNDLTLLHWLVLVHLSSKSPCKQTDLKSTTYIAPAYLTRLLDELTDRGLVRRHRSSQDRRQILLALTPEGRESAHQLLISLGELVDGEQRGAISNLVTCLEQLTAMMHGNELSSGQSRK